MSAQLHGQSKFDPSHVRAYFPSLEAYCGVRLVTLQDGVGRGVRVLEIRTGGGLEAEIVVDRGFDLGRVSLNAKTISWHGTNGYRAPWLLDLHGDRGMGFLRGIDGFMTTCGLDHIRQPETEKFAHSPVHPTGEIDFPLHGDGAFQPARIVGYGVNDDAEDPHIWCEGEIVQSVHFGHSLRLRRRYTFPIGSNQIMIDDQVKNIGAVSATHMLLYHFNIGHPLVGNGSVIRVPHSRQTWQSQEHDPFAPISVPSEMQPNQISVHEFADHTEAGQCVVENQNSGLRLELNLSRDTLPNLQILRMPSAGIYGVGIEPCTHGQRTRAEVRKAGEMSLLQRGAERIYSLSFSFEDIGNSFEAGQV